MNRELVAFANRHNVEVLPDNAQWRNRFEIRSESSTRLYTVAQRKSDGTWGCSCPGWKTRRTCKHLSAMLPALRQLTAETVA
jgi:hypothetical protein